MSIRTRLAAGTGVVAIAAAIALAGSAPASAHSGQFFTSAFLGDVGPGFATISQTDATLAYLPQVAEVGVSAVEIWNEAGYAINGEGQDNDTLLFWDHTTGAITGTAPITLDPLFFDGAFINTVRALDTTKGSSLPDGTILTLAEINFGEEVNEGLWLSSIDSTTGVLTPLVDLTGYIDEFEDAEGDDLFIDSLATDPTTGITYVLVDFDDGTPQYLAVDIANDFVAPPAPLPGVNAILGDGYMMGADFTDTGVLHYFYSVFGEGEPRVFASLSAAITANPAGVFSGILGDVSTPALAYDPAPKLAATGLNFVNPAIAALALLGLGGAVVVISRRRLTAAP